MLGSICQLPMYECFGCAATRRLPAGVLRVYRDVVWCEECYSEDDVGPDWHDLPAFVPKHEVELAKLRAVVERDHGIMTGISVHVKSIRNSVAVDDELWAAMKMDEICRRIDTRHSAEAGEDEQ